jgi:tetratricopeptide (TPR) repeat protein
MNLQMLLNQAVALHREGRLPEAEALYREVLAQSPSNFQLQHRLAQLLFQQRRFDEALKAIAVALAIKPDVAESLALKGAILAALGQLGLAIGYLDRALALRPDLGEALYNRALALIQLNHFAEAVESLDRFLARIPQSAEGWANRGVALQGANRLADALASYDRALAIEPMHAPALFNRGSALEVMGRFDDALASFDQVVKHLPRHARAWLGRANALMVLERYEEALNSLDRALTISPGDPKAVGKRADLLQTMELFRNIPAGLDEAGAWYHRAAILYVRKRFEDALSALEKALSLTPDYAEALTLKGAVLFESKQVEAGMETFRRHAELVYRNRPIRVETDPPHKQRHDAEQRDYLKSLGLNDDGFRLEAGARTASRAVNPANAEAVPGLWANSDPQIVVIDNLLTEEALEALRRFCWGSTIWPLSYKDGYLGAMPETGFACPLLAQIADELRQVFPSVIGDHGLRRSWAFKYDSRLAGIPMHADQAAVNVNFWIAPEDANTDPESGGLVVWDKKAPRNWDFARYNTDEAAIRAFLAEKSAKPITVPHRTNRAVIFDSDLFHETDRILFREGYRNRRINVTMLYGRRTYHGG